MYTWNHKYAFQEDTCRSCVYHVMSDLFKSISRHIYLDIYTCRIVQSFHCLWKATGTPGTGMSIVGWHASSRYCNQSSCNCCRYPHGDWTPGSLAELFSNMQHYRIVVKPTVVVMKAADFMVASTVQDDHPVRESVADDWFCVEKVQSAPSRMEVTKFRC